MSYRLTAITGLRFDERLRGSGAQTHNDWGFSLAVKRRDWKLIYDPAVAVDHYLGQRIDEDQRTAFNPIACFNAAHNETVVLLDHLSPGRRFVYVIWAMIVGTRSRRGFLQWLRFLPSEGPLVSGQKWLVSTQGRWQGWWTWRRSCKGNGRVGKSGSNALTIG